MSLAQERFKSDKEFRYQIVSLLITFNFARFIIPIALFKMFLKVLQNPNKYLTLNPHKQWEQQKQRIQNSRATALERTSAEATGGVVKHFLASWSCKPPPYLSDLSPCYCILFQLLNKKRKWV